MEENMMINTTSPKNPRKCTSLPSHSIINSIFPAWKLYENPFYTTQPPQDNSNSSSKQSNDSFCKKQVHHLQLPVSARKIAASFWDLTFVKPLMESELESCRARILDLKSELEYERRERKKMDLINKKLAKELNAERKNREAYESLCEKLGEEISGNKMVVDRLKKEIEEERKMIRVSEVLREERVQMKLSEAKHFLEEKLKELNPISSTLKCPNDSDNLLYNRGSCRMQHYTGDNTESVSELTQRLNEISISKNQENIRTDEDAEGTTTPYERLVESSLSEEGRRSSLTEKSTMSDESCSSVQSKGSQGRKLSESVNPHIRRGIKGFVEFPKVIRAMGSKSQRYSGNKLECQKAQIRMILKQKSPLKAYNSVITS